jgi:hypothetical protein
MREVAGSIPNETSELFSTYLIRQPHYCPEINGTRNLPCGDRAQPALNADTLTAICELIVRKMWDPRRLSTTGLHVGSN